jgi:hypothetical protein
MPFPPVKLLPVPLCSIGIDEMMDFLARTAGHVIQPTILNASENIIQNVLSFGNRFSIPIHAFHKVGGWGGDGWFHHPSPPQNLLYFPALRRELRGFHAL